MGNAYRIILLLTSMTSGFYLSAAITVIMQCFFDNGIVWSRKKACVLGIYSVLSEAINIFFPNSFILNILSLAAYAVIPVYDCKGKLIRRTLKVSWAYFVTMMCVVCMMLTGVAYLLPGYDSEAVTNTEILIININTTILFGAVFHYLKHRVVRHGLFVRFGKKEKTLLYFYVVAVFSIFAVMTVGAEYGENWTRGIQGFMSIVSILLMLLFPLFIFYSRLSDQYRRLYEYQETYLEAELEHFRRYRDAQQETACFRHDIRNNLLCLEELMSSGKNNEAAEYLHSLLQTVRGLSPKYVSGDEILDCIISAKAASMEQEGITFTLDGVIAGGLKWKAIDICGVFANALDNAMEACAALPRGERRISVSLKTAEQLRLIRIENSVAGEVDTSRLFSEMGGYTTKKASEKHGIGTYNMKRIVEKYGGIIRAECADGVFSLEFIINKGNPV